MEKAKPLQTKSLSGRTLHVRALGATPATRQAPAQMPTTTPLPQKKIIEEFREEYQFTNV